MSIVFSALVPHSPLLIPAIGKENQALLKKTSDSYAELEADLYAAQPDIIVIITPHGNIQPDLFTISLNPEYKADYEEFGDFATRFKANGEIGLAYKIRERLETSAPVRMDSESKLDHGSSIPLYLLTSHLQQFKILPIYHSGLNLEAHFKFGKLLKRDFLVDQQRIAIIASGDLSHKLAKNSPAGYSPKAKKFDQRILDIILKRSANELLKITPKAAIEAEECGLKSIAMLMGILDGIKYETKLLSYEAPFGVGYAVIKFNL